MSDFSRNSGELNSFIRHHLPAGLDLSIYPGSLYRVNGTYFFMARRPSGDKFLYILSDRASGGSAAPFVGDVFPTGAGVDSMSITRCPLSNENARALRKVFPFTSPVTLGTGNSFGFGDRLGVANPGHIRAFSGAPLKPVIAQQSIRELERTGRTPEEVMDAATWAVFQEGYRGGFGADADHLKTTDDITRMAHSGFTMFTFDPGEHVDKDAERLPVSELAIRGKLLPWDELEDSFAGYIKRYGGRRFRVSDILTLEPDETDVVRGIVKYGKVIAHARKCALHLEEIMGGRPHEIELSVDETDSPTTPFEHFLIAHELGRLGVRLVSLAPRFVGDFEKGVDYRGDIRLFETEYRKHLDIARACGGYKLSLHSGSDKFSVYDVIGRYKDGSFHVKTAGTSYLEALRTVAAHEPSLFREILDFSRGRYDADKRSYHVSADPSKVPAAATIPDDSLLELFDQDDVRQVLHVTFGTVLTARRDDGGTLFRDRMMQCLEEHEETHYGFLVSHFHRHIEPLVT